MLVGCTAAAATRWRIWRCGAGCRARRRHRAAAPSALAAVLLAGGSVGGNLLLTWLAGRVDASYLFPLVQGSIIVGVTLCSVPLFRENFRRAAGSVFCWAAAIAVINL
ncbi:MAG: hypothetical protein ACLR7U_07460 [Ruthenibacterium lactatiformans]